MLEEVIKSRVADQEGRTFRPIGDIAKDVEREIWDCSLFPKRFIIKLLLKMKQNKHRLNILKHMTGE